MRSRLRQLPHGENSQAARVGSEIPESFIRRTAGKIAEGSQKTALCQPETAETESLYSTATSKKSLPGSSVPVGVFATYHPAATLPGRDVNLYNEIVEDLATLWKGRDPLKPVQYAETVEELTTLFPNPDVIGLDLEWRQSGAIRMCGVSNGTTNVICKDVKVVLKWLEAK